MDEINGSNKRIERNRSKHNGGLSRRTIIKTAVGAAGVVAGASGAHSDVVPAAGYGAPLVEIHVPAGRLTTEEKSDMIKGVTDVIVDAIKLPPSEAKKLWVQIFETADGGWGVGGQVFVPRHG